MSRPYNGFTPAERRLAKPVIDAAIARGEIVLSRSCAICGSVPRKIGMHLEDYRDPLSFIPICGSCHSCIHLRFWRGPDWWRVIPALPSALHFLKSLSLDLGALSQSIDLTYPDGIPRIETEQNLQPVAPNHSVPSPSDPGEG